MFSKQMRLKAIAISVIIAFGATILPVGPVSAALIDNNRVAEAQSIEGDRAVVEAFMTRDDVRSQFEALGVDPDEAGIRVAALSDAEVAQLADNIKSAPAGQGALGGIVGAIVLVFIILLITDLLGFTDVFGFTNKGSANPT